MDAAGNLYGTTMKVASRNCLTRNSTVAERCSNYLQRAEEWTETVLHNFGNGTDGQYP